MLEGHSLMGKDHSQILDKTMIEDLVAGILRLYTIRLCFLHTPLGFTLLNPLLEPLKNKLEALRVKLVLQHHRCLGHQAPNVIHGLHPLLKDG